MAARRHSGPLRTPPARPTPRAAARARRGRGLLKLIAVGLLALCVVGVAAAHYAVLRPPPVVTHQASDARPRRQPRTTAAAECANTYGHAPHAVADSRGGVCAPDELDRDGCCCQSSRPCDRCAASSCCDTYEHCVACCVSNAGAKTRKLVRKNAVHAVLKGAKDDFELCRFRCLTNSGSTLHQNSYRSKAERHCFGTERPPLDPRMSINADIETLRSLTANGHADRRDPYVGGGSGYQIFPCDVEGCAAPEQDVHKLAAKGGADRKKRASDRRAKKQKGAVAAEAAKAS